MPREYVPDSHEDIPSQAWVCWGPDTHVQVATTPPDGIPFWWQVLASGDDSDTVDKRLAVLGELARKVTAKHVDVDEETTDFLSPSTPNSDTEIGRDLLNSLDVTYGPMDGMYVSLERRGVNDLIRLLRKARDSAFGRDE